MGSKATDERRSLLSNLRAVKCAVAEALFAVIVKRARAATARRFAQGAVRTLWASTPILTLPILARCDRLLEFRSSSLVFNTYYITRSFDINLILFEGAVRLTRSRWCLSVFRHFVFAWALLRFDVFHYFYDRGLLLSEKRYGINSEEIELLLKSDKRLYTYAYGADVRSRDITLDLGQPIFAKNVRHGSTASAQRTCLILPSSLLRERTAQVAMGEYGRICTGMPGYALLADRCKETGRATGGLPRW